MSLIKKGTALLLAGATAVTLSACSKEAKPKEEEESVPVISEYTDLVSEEPEQKIEKKDLPDFYDYYNVFSGSLVNIEHGFAYYQLDKEKEGFINRILQYKEPTVEEAEQVINELQLNPEIAQETYQSRNCTFKIIGNDEHSVLLRADDGSMTIDCLAQVKEGKGYSVGFKDIKIIHSNSDCLIGYSYPDKRIVTYNKLTGDLIALENVIYLKNDDNTVYFVRCDEKENIYSFDVANCVNNKQKVSNLTIRNKYVSYIADEQFNLIDLANHEKQEKALGNDNSWLKLSDGSIIYVRKDGVHSGFASIYRVMAGSLDSDYCVLSNLQSIKDENGMFIQYSQPYYFNKNLDTIYELPNFQRMINGDEDNGYILFLQTGNSRCFLDLTTGRSSYLSNIVESDDYIIYHVSRIPSNSNGYSIIKDDEGNTILTIEDDFGSSVQKYYPEQKIAIQSSLTDENRTAFGDPNIIDVSNPSNPKVILESNSNHLFDLYETEVNNVFKAYWKKENKYSLMDIRGNELTDRVDMIVFTAMDLSSEIESSRDESLMYIAHLGLAEEDGMIHKYRLACFDDDGNLLSYEPPRNAVDEADSLTRQRTNY